jgi:hypothetical protein
MDKLVGRAGRRTDLETSQARNEQVALEALLKP